MSKLPQDNAIRQQALAVDQSFIIQAPAGSGKTALLIKRFLVLLSVVDEPEEIIAITFTRKAAAEMQGRLLAALKQANGEPDIDNEHKKELFNLAAAALKKDHERGWHLLENSNRLRIQTIDSLSASLTKQMPILAGLGSQPEIIENAQPFYELAANRTLAELESKEIWSDSIALLLSHLDNDVPRVKRLLISMLMKRDQWLGYVMQEHDRQDMETVISRIVEDQLATLLELFPNKYQSDLLELLRFAAANLTDTNADHCIAAFKDITEFPGADTDSLAAWCAIRELLLTLEDSWRKLPNVKIGFPSQSTKKLDLEQKELRQTNKEKMQALISKLQKVDGLSNALALTRSIPQGRYSETDWLIVESLCRLLKLAAAQLENIFVERHQMDFIGMANKALFALGTDDEPTDLARQMDYQCKHILIDEFQDVSVSQSRLVKALTREWSLDDGRTLFLVGDPMQSIYRFREADVSIFIRTFHEKYIGHVELIPLKLTVNFRSQKSLVTWFNDSFHTIFPKRDDIAMGAVSYSISEAYDDFSTDNNVTVNPLYGRQDKKEAESICEIINRIKEKAPDDSIAILVRGRTHLVEIINELREQSLSFSAIDIEQLQSRPVIQDLLALTRALLFPADRVAWLACLRAPWCGLSLESLHHLCHDSRHQLIMESLQDKFLMQGMNPVERKRAENLLRIIQEALKYREANGLCQTVESIWYQLGGPATINSESDLDNSETFFSLLTNIERGGHVDKLEELMAGIEQLYAAPIEDETSRHLQLMTIHKAKGLEFDHVILPGLGKKTRNNTDDLLAWLLLEQDGMEELVLAPIREAGHQASGLYKYINNISQERQTYEDLRLLYVASTRAKKTLHLFGHVSLHEDKEKITCVPDKRSMLSFLWPRVADLYDKYLPDELPDSQSGRELVLIQDNYRLADDWQLPKFSYIEVSDNDVNKTEVSGIEFDWASETTMHIGSVTHLMIQRIAEEGLINWNEQRIEDEENNIRFLLSQHGISAEKIENAFKQVKTALINMLKDKRGLWVLSDKHTSAANEFAISGFLKNTLINAKIDRTFIDDEGIRWIIDYKSSPHTGCDMDDFLDREPERYQEKLTMYAEMMSYLDDRPIRLALYYPLLNGWREWKYQQDKSA